MAQGRISPIKIDDEMQAAYLSYAMSVIVSRALPDARDGLKPVHRRILYAMHDMHLGPSSSHKKSARIVGEVLGKYHPHGDQAVYDAMARMAQDFSMRYILVDGQGNFGSIDGDAPAAMRYTEAKLNTLSDELLTDIRKDTVSFTPNFDDTLQEPTVLPAAIPNLLINGSTGIAVGMSTSIPPHNLSEVCDALIFMLQNWVKRDNVQVDDLMNFIPGPDFPTGGLILSSKSDDALASAYGSGRGKITTRAKIHVEEIGRGRNQLIVTELPYQTNKSSLIERIADLVREGRVDGISDLRDESDRQGMRIVMELSKAADPDRVIQHLFKLTPLETTFSIIMLALDAGEPRVLTLKQALRVFLDHRLEVVQRRSKFDLEQAKERAHILAGLLIALMSIDECIRIIRKSKDSGIARSRLMKSFKLSERQATAILDMALRRLAQLEQRQLLDEHKQVKQRIKHLERLLSSPKKMRDVVIQELEAIKISYGDRRRTHIVTKPGERTGVTAGDLILDEDVWVVVTKHGKISRVVDRRRPAVGRHIPLAVLRANARDTLYLFTAEGDCAALHVHTIPAAENPGQGASWDSVSALGRDADIVAAVGMPPAARAGTDGQWADVYLFLGTRMGMVKKIKVADLPGPSSRPFGVMKVVKNDTLLGGVLMDGSKDIMLVTNDAQAIRFNGDQVRPMGMGAAGVQGIRLRSDRNHVVALQLVYPRADLFLVTNTGEAKRTELKQFPIHGRNGKGVQAWKPGDDTSIAGAVVGHEEDTAVLLFAARKAKAIKLEKAPLRGRPSKGRQVITLNENEIVTRVVSLQNRFEVKGPDKLQASRSKSSPSTSARRRRKDGNNSKKKGKAIKSKDH